MTRKKRALGAVVFGLRFAAAVAVAAVALVGSAAAVPVSGASPVFASTNSAPFSDESGDSGGGPDIGGVTVSNDDAGTLSVAVTFANRSGLAPSELVSVDFDSDRGATTGESPFGWDYGIQLSGNQAILFRYEAASKEWVEKTTRTLSATWSGETLTLKLNVRELGSTKGFRFEVYADANPVDEAAPFDLAPGGPVPNFGQGWTYDVNITAPELTIKRLSCTPDPAVPGKRILAKAEVAVTRAGTPEVLPPTAHVSWRAKLGSLTLKPLGTKTTGAALTAIWKLPKAVKAKVIRITLTVTSEGITVTKTRLQRIGTQRRPALTRATAGGQRESRTREVTKRVKPVWKIMLLTPVQDAVIAQNDASIGCSAHPTFGYGHMIQFSWKVNNAKPIVSFELVAQHRNATLPIVNTTLTADSYVDRACHSFVIPANLEGWEWRVRGVDNGGNYTAWKQGTFKFAPCLLPDGRPCFAPG